MSREFSADPDDDFLSEQDLALTECRNLRTKLAAAQAEIERLTAWKREADAVMAPLQDIARRLGFPLGTSIPHELVALVEAQKHEIATLRKLLGDLVDDYSADNDLSASLSVKGARDHLTKSAKGV